MTQTVQVLDADTGKVLDTRTMRNFASGCYMIWSLKGHVKLHWPKATNSPIVTVSGIFVD